MNKYLSSRKLCLFNTLMQMDKINERSFTLVEYIRKTINESLTNK